MFYFCTFNFRYRTTNFPLLKNLPHLKSSVVSSGIICSSASCSSISLLSTSGVSPLSIVVSLFAPDFHLTAILILDESLLGGCIALYRPFSCCLLGFPNYPSSHLPASFRVVVLVALSNFQLPIQIYMRLNVARPFKETVFLLIL